MEIEELTAEEKREAIANWIVNDFFEYGFKKLCEKDNKMEKLKDCKKQLKKMMEYVANTLSLDWQDGWEDVYEEYFN